MLDPAPLSDHFADRMAHLAHQQRFEQAATWRDRLQAARRGITSAAELRAFGAVSQIVAASTRPGGWDIHVIRHGRMAGAAFCPSHGQPRRVVDTLVAAAECVDRPPRPATAALVAESRLVLRWLHDARLVGIEGDWVMPVAAHG